MDRDILHACPFRKFYPDHAVGLACLVAFGPGDRDLRLNRAVGGRYSRVGSRKSHRMPVSFAG